ncbi:hypothetical protein IWW34DRAFT_232725 [Fusarium oxysporum f. sp. albedinis]|nr:hypothetical protein IWW34DRAFT_385109 [Fusarium oxysporum f. sp. albedinis]KAI3572088.1 hypothetical protein IWW34DRAFT_232725 [Fusarium oxysporum f. sp. albedinis]
MQLRPLACPSVFPFLLLAFPPYECSACLFRIPCLSVSLLVRRHVISSMKGSPQFKDMTFCGHQHLMKALFVRSHRVRRLKRAWCFFCFVVLIITGSLSPCHVTKTYSYHGSI